MSVKNYLLMNAKAGLTIVLTSIWSVIAVSGQGTRAVDSIPSSWSYVSDYYQQSPADDLWWQSFHDTALDSLIADGVENNYNIAMAVNRLASARAAIGQARSGYMPSLRMSASWTKGQMSAVTTRFHGAHSIDDYFSLGLDMSWELDVFGRVREGVNAKKADFRATRAQYDAAMVSVAAQIATSYFQLRMYQEALALAQEHCAEQTKVLKIAEARMEAGLASMLDVTQAKVVLASTEASIPTIENNIRSCKSAIAVMLGEYPGAIAQRFANDSTSHLPDHRLIISTGIPAELLRRRPDILEAEARIAAAAAQLGIAKKDFLPALSINGSIGTESYKFNGLFTDDSFSYSISPTLTWTLFDGLSRKYEMTQARLNVENCIDSYNMTVLNAVAEVDNAMGAYVSTLQQIDRLGIVTEQSRKSLDLSLDLYKQGLTEFSNVVNSQIDLLQYQNELIQARGNALVSLVTLYKALGGGWQENI